ncbi:MAG: PD-(D/E)XK nuclease family protein, partial [Kiritimatiellae bacterium]|nr:PD-(D/E)XK nuclease family protein [Kiritimatiellia bacterium]
PRLPLSIPLPHAGEPSTPDWRLSASAIDKWLSCPLSYLLEFGLNMRRTEEKDELGFDNFGSLVHKALEAYAQQQLERSARGLPQLLDERDIRDAVNRIFASVRSAYGAAPSLKIRLQLDAAESRLSNFASLQAKWAEEGWRVALPPEFKFTVRPFAGEGDADICIHGSIDRIDFKEGVGYRIIDYKTWDDKGKAPAHILSSGGAEADFALALGLPTLPPARANAAPKRFLSIQLPLYRRCLEVADSAQFGGKVADCCYLVLGKNPENTHVFGSEIFNDPAAGAAALDTARLAIRAIRASLFWPPGPGTALNYGFGDIFLNSPESDLKGSGWLAAQQRRLTAFTKGGQRP